MSKVMLVTGGSRGIGAAVAKLAARRGYAVGVNYRTHSDAADAVVAEIQREGGNALAIQADVSQEDQVEHMFRTLDDRLGRLDALVNNAGILETQMRLDQMDADRLMRVLSTNVIGAFLCAREAVRRMSTRQGSGARRHPREWRAPRHHLHRHACQRRRTRPGGSAEERDPAAPGRLGGRSGGRRHVAVL